MRLAHIAQLQEGDEPRTSAQAQQAVAVFLAYLDATQRRLQERHDEILAGKKGGHALRAQLRRLARIVRRLFEASRYLDSGTVQGRPHISQAVVQRLIDQHWPKGAEYARERVVALVRGRWEFCYTHFSLLKHLDVLAETTDAVKNAPARELMTKSTEALHGHAWLEYLWKAASLPGEPPRQVTVLSYPRIAEGDMLLSPLLIHELGHMLDDAFLPTLTARALPQLNRAGGVAAGGTGPVDDGDEGEQGDQDEIADVVVEGLRKHYVKFGIQQHPTVDECEQVRRVISSAVAEFTADLIALRLLGISYVAGLAECLKTELDPDDPSVVVEGTGEGQAYPGYSLRLSMLAREAMDGHDGEQGARVQLRALETHDKTGAVSRTLNYLEDIVKLPLRAGPSLAMVGAMQAAQDDYCTLQVTNAFPEIARIVRQYIPAGAAECISSEILPVIEQLTAEDRTHALKISPDVDYPHLLFAGWAYQLHLGDDLEERTLAGRYSRVGGVAERNDAADHYLETNRLLQDALRQVVSGVTS